MPERLGSELEWFIGFRNGVDGRTFAIGPLVSLLPECRCQVSASPVEWADFVFLSR